MWMMIFVSYKREKKEVAEIKKKYFFLFIDPAQGEKRGRKKKNYAMPHCDFMNQGQTMERINCDSFSSVLYQHVDINFFFCYFGTKRLKCCCCKCFAINFPTNPPSILYQAYLP